MKSATFIKLAKFETVREFVAEGIRVGYKCNREKGYFEILDEGELVMKGYQQLGGVWMLMFSKAYWQEPAGLAVEVPV